MPYNTRIAPVELRTYRVRAILRQVLTESDGDWHLVLEDPGAPGRTMVGEVPNANCALGSPYASRFDVVRRELRGAPKNAVVELTGLGFYDYIHGQRGVAPNGIELHPVIAARVIGRPVGAAADTSAAVGGTKVWVNTGSMVYHCPGTRYYGATKAGYFATEAKAVAAGARPAYGRKCGP